MYLFNCHQHPPSHQLGFRKWCWRKMCQQRKAGLEADLWTAWLLESKLTHCKVHPPFSWKVVLLIGKFIHIIHTNAPQSSTGRQLKKDIFMARLPHQNPPMVMSESMAPFTHLKSISWRLTRTQKTNGDGAHKDRGVWQKQTNLLTGNFLTEFMP